MYICIYIYIHIRVFENTRNITEVARCRTIQRVSPGETSRRENCEPIFFFFENTKAGINTAIICSVLFMVLRHGDLSRGKGKGKVKVCSP